jgi:hypothetical protein
MEDDEIELSIISRAQLQNQNPTRPWCTNFVCCGSNNTGTNRPFWLHGTIAMSPYPLPPTLSNSDLYLAPCTTKINPTMIDARCSMPHFVFAAYSDSPHSWQQITVPSILLSNHRQSPPIALTLGWSNPLPSISNQQSEVRHRQQPTTTTGCTSSHSLTSPLNLCNSNNCSNMIMVSESWLICLLK